MGDRWGTARIEAFSDGVFAIAITLLVLEISVPESGFDNLWHGIAGEWPSYLAYATSFLTIGWIWLIHHRIFRRMEYADDWVLRINLVLLMAVAFLPFPTKLLADAIHDVDAERVAAIFYGATLLVISLLMSVLWGAISRDRKLVKRDVSEHDINTILKATTPSIGFYVAVIAIAVFAPRVAPFGYLAIAIIAVLRVHGDEEPSSERGPT